MTTHVRVEVNAGIAVLTLDGPEKLNAFSATTAAELGAAYAACEADDAVRVVVLTGAGRAFCAGADLSPGADSFAPPDAEFSASPIRPPAFELGKLVIAAINGHAIGIGLTTALQCDLRIVAADATLAIPQVRLGMLGDAQSHFTLPRLVGAELAADLLLTGRSLTGAAAAERGLASRALPAEEVLPAALALAAEVAATVDPASVAASKRILWGGLDAAAVADAETAAHRVLMNRPGFGRGTSLP